MKDRSNQMQMVIAVGVIDVNVVRVNLYFHKTNCMFLRDHKRLNFAHPTWNGMLLHIDISHGYQDGILECTI
jgi:hypothetical protein